MNPQQELFTFIRVRIEAMGYDVYDGFLPPEGTPYPFVYLGETAQTDEANKSKINGRVSAVMHVWSDTPRKRGTLSQILLDIKRMCYSDIKTPNHAFSARSVEERILPDTTTKTPLLHGIITAQFYFS